MEIKLINEQEVLGKTFKMYGSFEEPLFLAKDVATWIEHSKASVMLSSIDEEEKLRETIFTSGQRRAMWFLTEEGLYEVLMQSRKPIAKQFKQKVKAILKELRTVRTVSFNELSPQLQFMFNIEREQKRQASEIQNTNKRIDNLKNVIALNSSTWRHDANKIVGKIADSYGGVQYYKEVYDFIYKEIDIRGGVDLSRRLANKKRRALEKGAGIARCNAINTIDVIADDRKLIEIYVAIVKELAISRDIGL